MLLPHLRKLLFFAGLAAVLLSVVLDGTFATDSFDPPGSVPEPNVLALMGVGGAAAILLSLIRGRRK